MASATHLSPASRASLPRSTTQQRLSARLARARGAEGAARGDGGGADRDSAHHRRQGDPHRDACSRSVMPHDHRHVLADWHAAGPEHVQQAIAAAAEARREWASWAWHERAAVFLRAAELLTTTWRADDQRGDDARPVEDGVPGGDRRRLGDDRLLAVQPATSRRSSTRSSRSAPHAMWNALEYRPLEGFVYAVTPFNFTSIAGNLPTAPALMGNTVVWKPASSAMLSALLHHASCSRRPACRPASSTSCPATPSMISNIAARLARPGRHPLHRQHRRVPVDVEDGRAEHRRATGAIRGWSARPAARTSSSRTRRPTRRSWRWRSSRGGFEYPGTEVLGGEPHLRAAVALAGGPRSRGGDDARHQDGRRRATSARSWAR